MGIILKELKECRTALKVIRKKEMIKPVTKLEGVYKETGELIAIIGKSISTAKKKTGWLCIDFNVSRVTNWTLYIEHWLLHIYFN